MLQRFLPGPPARVLVSDAETPGPELIDPLAEQYRASGFDTGKLVGATGRVLPATCEPVVLKAHVGREEVEGQVAVQNSGPIGAVSLVPEDAEPPQVATGALAWTVAGCPAGMTPEKNSTAGSVPSLRRS